VVLILVLVEDGLRGQILQLADLQSFRPYKDGVFKKFLQKTLLFFETAKLITFFIKNNYFFAGCKK
jgi:hypothetical protein